MTLGQNLQAVRRAKGLSQETLAEKIGVSRQALGKWEKDIALPGLDNLQAAAQVLGVSVDTLLGTGCADPAPAVTLDAMRDLLAARDAEQRRRRRLWGLLGAAGAIVAVLLLIVQNMAYQRKMQSLTDSYANLQQQLGSTTAALTARMDELQDAVRQGKSTVLDWQWIPLDKLHKDVQNSWMPVLVQVTPSESTAGMTARLSVTYGDTTGLYDMDELQKVAVVPAGHLFGLGDGIIQRHRVGFGHARLPERRKILRHRRCAVVLMQSFDLVCSHFCTYLVYIGALQPPERLMRFCRLAL